MPQEVRHCRPGDPFPQRQSQPEQLPTPLCRRDFCPGAEWAGVLRRSVGTPPGFGVRTASAARETPAIRLAVKSWTYNVGSARRPSAAAVLHIPLLGPHPWRPYGRVVSASDLGPKRPEFEPHPFCRHRVLPLVRGSVWDVRIWDIPKSHPGWDIPPRDVPANIPIWDIPIYIPKP